MLAGMVRAIALWATTLGLLFAAIVQVAGAGPISRPPMGPPQRRNAAASGASPVTPASTPHPAVVRIIVKERDGESMGSGSLIDIRDSFGLVITNWHVIRDAAGDITVVFPDGFKSAARIVKADRDWDLAALSIWRPPVKPLPIATVAPQPGDTLSIAGYGATGDYRHVAGRCTQYQAPSEKHPFEIVELSAEARQGDSGGPIFNERGELAGVLFGSSDGTTSGSYAGRIQEFLGTLIGEGGDGKPLHDTPVLAGHNKPPISVPPLLNGESSGDASSDAKANDPSKVAANKAPINPRRKQAEYTDSVLEPIQHPGGELVSHGQSSNTGEPHDDGTYVPDDPPEPREHAEQHRGFDFVVLLGETPFDQAKSALAAVGIIAIVMRVMKLSGGGG